MKTSKLLSVVLSVLTALVVLTGSIAVPLLCRPFYYAHIGPLGLEEYYLSREQIEALESIGMDWQAPGERAWEKAFGRAKAYYELNHHLEIPKGYEAEDGFRLDLWVKRQRKQYRERNEKVLTRERIARLESLGMRW